MAAARNVSPIPAGYHSVTPYLIVDGAAAALDFYARALGAREVMRMPRPDGKVAHAEILIGNSHVMLADEYPDMGFRGPQAGAGTPVSLMVYVPDCDSTFAAAIAAGATELRAVANQFYGDRSGTFRDPYGHVWTVSTHVEDVSEEEIQRRMAAMKPQH
jgi:PhnB protein